LDKLTECLLTGREQIESKQFCELAQNQSDNGIKKERLRPQRPERWTTEADELACPSTYKYKYKYVIHTHFAKAFYKIFLIHSKLDCKLQVANHSIGYGKVEVEPTTAACSYRRHSSSQVLN